MMVACMTQQGLNLTFDIKNKAENIALLVCFHFVSDMSVLSLSLSILLNLIGKLLSSKTHNIVLRKVRLKIEF